MENKKSWRSLLLYLGIPIVIIIIIVLVIGNMTPENHEIF